MNFLKIPIEINFVDSHGNVSSSTFEFGMLRAALYFGWLKTEDISLEIREEVKKLWREGLEIEDFKAF